MILHEVDHRLDRKFEHGRERRGPNSSGHGQQIVAHKALSRYRKVNTETKFGNNFNTSHRIVIK